MRVMTDATQDRPWYRALAVPRSAELGLWPVIFALGLIAIGFHLANDAFLTPRNLSNLVMQTGTLGAMTLGVVLVLLIGEIDLSIGAVSGFTACVMGILATLHGWPAWAAIGAAVLLGASIGLVQGAWIVFFQAPSFIVTLAGLLIWQGLQLRSLGDQNGQLRIEDPGITGVASNFLPLWAGWALATAVILVTVAYLAVRRVLAARSSYGTEPLAKDVSRAVLVALTSIAVVGVLNAHLGVPYLLIVLLVLTLGCAVVAGSTVFGRHIYAVGGNAEAARRTGIRVGALRVVIFMSASSLASLAGVLEAARGYAVSVNSGGGNASLNAIAAAVIGGTSLFGGRGRLAGALLGALVISSVQNGLALLGEGAATQVVITGLILLAAITLDVTSRRRRLSPGARGA